MHAAGATKDAGAHLAQAAQAEASSASTSLQEGNAQAAGAVHDKGHEAAEAVQSNTQVPCFCRALVCAQTTCTSLCFVPDQGCVSRVIMNDGIMLACER